MILGLALLAGVASWLWGEALLDHFKPPERQPPNRYSFVALNLEIARVNALNGALTFGALGGFLGLALGLAGGVTRVITKVCRNGRDCGLRRWRVGGCSSFLWFDAVSMETPK